jgi:ATP-binding protein involved in chromosome partitioning
MSIEKQENPPGNALTREAVMDALKTVNDPELHRDLVSLNMVKSVMVEDGVARVTIELTTPACPLKDKIGGDIRAALAPLPGFRDVTIDFTANTAGRQSAKGDLTPGVRNIIAVGSGKGGVGKSTTSLNLAVALAQSGASVGLLDADIYGPNIPAMMGLTGQPKVVGDKMIPVERFGIKVISMGLLVGEDQPVVWRGPMLNNALRQFFGDVAWGELDYLIVDLPPGTGDVQISLVQLAPVTGAVIVTTPQGVSLMDARKAMAMFHLTNTPVLGIVENMSYFLCPDCGKRHDIFATGGGEQAARELDIPFLGAIPLGIAVREGGDKGVPVTVSDPDGEQSLRFTAIARTLAGRVSVANLEGGGKGEVQIKLGGH